MNNAPVRVREVAPAAQVPSEERLFRLYGSALTSFLAGQRMGLDEGEQTFQERAKAFLSSRCRNALGISYESWIAQVVAVKVKRHDDGARSPTPDEECESSDAADRCATDYYKASRGD